MRRRKWRWLPRVSYTNFKKSYPNTRGFTRWVWVSRYWGGRLINVGIRHHVLNFDFRHNWVEDMLMTDEREGEA